MNYSVTMTSDFEIKKNQKALAYTAFILAVLLLIFLIKWAKPVTPKPLVDDIIEINLGNMDIPAEPEQDMGGGAEPAKGEPAPQDQNEAPPSAPQQPSSSPDADENETSKEAPVVVKNNNPVKNNTVTKPTTSTNPVTQPAVVTAPKPAPKPKITMPGGTGTGGANGTNDDNYGKGRGDGNGTGGTGNGTGAGNGNGPGGQRPPSQPPRITKHYSFNGDLPKATIIANIKVSANGVGSFAGFAKNSTNTDRRYADDIRQRLKHMEFPKFERDYTQQVTFYYTEN